MLFPHTKFKDRFVGVNEKGDVMKKFLFLPTLVLAVFFSNSSAMRKVALDQVFDKHTEEPKNFSVFGNDILSFSKNELRLWALKKKKRSIGAKEEHFSDVTKFDLNKILTVSYPKTPLAPEQLYVEEENTGSVIKLWDIKNKKIHTLEPKNKYGYLDNINKLDNETVFSHQMGTFLFWSVVKQKFLKSLGRQHQCVTNKEDKTSFCMLNKKSLFSVLEKKILMWNPEKQKPTKTFAGFDGHKSFIRSVEQVDETHFLSTDYHGVIKLWDKRYERPKQTFKGDSSLVNSVLRIGNNQFVSCTNQQITIWPYHENEVVLYKTDSNYITTMEKLTYRLIASGHRDGKIKIWDTETHTCVATIDAHEGPIKNLCAHTGLLLSSCKNIKPYFGGEPTAEERGIKCWKYDPFA